MISEAQRPAPPTDPLRLRHAATLGRYRYPYFVDYLKEWFLSNPAFGRDARGSLPPPVHRWPADPDHAATVRAGSLPARGRRVLSYQDDPRPP